VDARGRRQYRYHPQYRQIRNQTKFHRMLDFVAALPQIREYAKENSSCGLTTLAIVTLRSTATLSASPSAEKAGKCAT
jgi:DNA topoisomerase IB